MEKLIIKGNSKPQIQFLESCPQNDQTLYGGAAGPGKTWSGVVLPIYHNYVSVSGFRMQIFRETEDELEDNVVPECYRYYPHAGGVYNESKKIWNFPSGARVRLCFMSRAGAWKRYGGGNNTVQVFDESTKFHPDNFTVENWNRSECGIKPFRCYLTNPGGPSHMRFKTEFVDACPPIPDGPLRWSNLAHMWWQPVKASEPFYAKITADGVTKKIRRQFIPARVFDNEDMLAKNPGYVATLLDSSPDVRRMLLEGDWNLIIGQMFDSYRGDIHMRTFKKLLEKCGSFKNLIENWRWIGSVDYGNTTVMSVLVMNRESEIWHIGELTHINQAREVKARESRKFLEVNKYPEELDVVGDTDMFPGSTEVPNMENAASEYRKQGIKLRKVSKASPARTTFRKWQVDIMKNALDWRKDQNGLFTKRPKIYFCGERCPRICETLPALQKDPLNPDLIDEREPKSDHWFRSVIYGMINLYRPVSRNAEKKHMEQIQDKIRESVI